MKIALLTDGITPFVTGGMQRHSANLAKYFTLAGAQVTLVHCVPFGTLLPNNDEVNKSLFGEESDVQLDQIVTLHFPKPGKLPGHYILNSYKYARNIFSSLDWDNFDFVYAKGFCGWNYMEQKKKGLKLPPIGVKFHGYEMFQELPSFSQKLKAKLLQKPTRWNNENADFIFSYGGKITQLIHKEFDFPKENIWDFTSGIDENWLRTKTIALSPKVNFVFVGRNEVRKGVKELKQVIAKLIPAYDFEIHFVGPIPDDEKIAANRIVYHGELKSKKEICDVLDEMDVLLCPSHSEGMPNVILEGMARGLAIIATNVGAVEMLVDDANGKLIDAMDINQLEKSIIEFIELPSEQLLQKREASRQKVSNDYLWNNLIQRIAGKISDFKK